MAIAWLYRADFERAGFPLLPVVEPDGRRTARHAVLFSLLLIPVSLTPYLLGMPGPAYAVGAAAGGLGILWLAISFALKRVDLAHRLLFPCPHYLPCCGAAERPLSVPWSTTQYYRQ